MPYILTTKTPLGPPSSNGHRATRRAVATLEEARDITAAKMAGAIGYDHDRGLPDIAPALALPEQGGTIGPLPDETVIEVERVGWRTIAGALGEPSSVIEALASNKRIIAAYNAAQGAE